MKTERPTESAYYLAWTGDGMFNMLGFDTMFEAASYMQTVLQENQEVTKITLNRKRRRR